MQSGEDASCDHVRAVSVCKLQPFYSRLTYLRLGTVSVSPTALALMPRTSHSNTSPAWGWRDRSGESRKSYLQTPICVIAHCQLALGVGSGRAGTPTRPLPL